MLLTWIHKTARKRYHSLGFQSEMLETSAGWLHTLVREGDGKRGSVILVHGLGTSSNSWIRTIPRIDDFRRLAALDLPGFGFSSVRGAEGFATFGEHRAALSEFLAGFQDGPLTLVGHSFGGWLCAWYAATKPGRVQHLVLVNSVGIYYRGIEALRETFTLNSVADTKYLLKRMWHRYPWYLNPFTGAIYRELKLHHVNELVASIETDDLLVEELTRLTMPVSLIWGREDGIVSLEVVHTLLRLVPRGQVFFVEQCGHVPQLEKSGEFAATLNQVLRR
ncbi:MAG: alpha/beta hydrolase fold protein, partial [Bacteroidetes bacterium]|nr:alpha/beta hydrolase fold protein [Bacteroidota bacterium]